VEIWREIDIIEEFLKQSRMSSPRYRAGILAYDTVNNVKAKIQGKDCNLQHH
jgi:hypothetical protein